VAEFRERIPLGSASKAVMTDDAGLYRGIVPTAAAYRPDLEPDAPIAPLATLTDVTVLATTDIQTVLRLFDEAAADEIAVLDDAGRVLGIVSEKHARRRYFEEIEASQREIFGET
jgi:CIC family chloride channel protein